MKTFSTYSAILIAVVFAVMSCGKEIIKHLPPFAPINNAPVADAGQDTVIFMPSDSSLLDGSKSQDPDSGDVISYKWTKISGPEKFILAAENSAQCRVTNLEKGIYVFELTIKDKYFAYSTDTVIVNVIAPIGLEEIIVYDSLIWQIKKEQKIVYMETPDLTTDEIDRIRSVYYYVFDFDFLNYRWIKLSKDGNVVGYYYYSIRNNRVWVYKYYDDDHPASTVFVGNQIKIIFR
jgi:hypothetical protein